MRPAFMTYYFPNWHTDPRNDDWHGKNWTEWECTKCAVPRFPGHLQPKVPLWGYVDEADPEVMAKKIEAAKSHGVDGFIFDWYWFNDGSYRIRCLEEGFFGAKNQEEFQFAVMWANHSPIYVHPASRRDIVNHTQTLLDGHLTEETFVKATDHCIRNYFWRPNYRRTSTGLFFCIFSGKMLLESFGSVEETRRILDDFRARAAAAGFEKLDLTVIGDGWLDTGDLAEGLRLAGRMGFDSVSSHGFPREDGVSEFPHVTFDGMWEKCFELTERYLAASKETGVNFYVTGGAGWDVSPRTVPSEMYEDVGYPFSRICNDDTPEKLARHLGRMRAMAEAAGCEQMNFFAFNEWTEGGFLEPDETWGYGKLEAVKAVFGKD